MARMKIKLIPPQGKICAYYDLKSSPITFDFVHFLAAAVGYSKSIKLNSIDLVVVCDAWRTLTPREKSYDASVRNWRLWNLLVQVVQICPAVRNFSIQRSPLSSINADCFPQNYNPRSNYLVPYSPKYVEKFYSVGVDVRCFAASKRSRDFASGIFKGDAVPITLSPRTAGYDGVRNSVLDNWYEAYKVLISMGHEVLVIPDQDDVLGGGCYRRYPWRTLPEAAMSLDIKLGIYELSLANVVSSGGNIGPLIYSGARFGIVKTLNEESHVSTAAFHESQGFPPGSQYPWFGEGQRIMWGDDSTGELLACVESQLRPL